MGKGLLYLGGVLAVVLVLQTSALACGAMENLGYDQLGRDDVDRYYSNFGGLSNTMALAATKEGNYGWWWAQIADYVETPQTDINGNPLPRSGMAQDMGAGYAATTEETLQAMRGTILVDWFWMNGGVLSGSEPMVPHPHNMPDPMGTIEQFMSHSRQDPTYGNQYCPELNPMMTQTIPERVAYMNTPPQR